MAYYMIQREDGSQCHIEDDRSSADINYGDTVQTIFGPGIVAYILGKTPPIEDPDAESYRESVQRVAESNRRGTETKYSDPLSRDFCTAQQTQKSHPVFAALSEQLQDKLTKLGSLTRKGSRQIATWKHSGLTPEDVAEILSVHGDNYGHLSIPGRHLGFDLTARSAWTID
jgi:hypothetical protein